ncbi:uncharacterized protein EV420DRAFT_1654439 [Desarmillaria tabescens]|uniref:Uncharacterized protein n=1 Tax=Armillaria tabescens TaxID=1929756 RepID=A0AA39MHC4_ARMTA|nr:uncharacterized protein EV420DRAFT_1654439 [Desarmillaria tabescens]KAK0433744.1 hypothetical protein EV420DRAFT_1654439 [Desarmillaria tabescens]
MSSHDSVVSSNRRSKRGRVQVSPTIDNTLSTVDVGIPAPVSSARSATSAPPKKRVRRGDPLDSLDPRSPSVPAPGESAYSLLPPVTVSHPSGVAYQQLRHRVSYGDLTPEEIVAVLHQRRIAAADPRGLAPSPVAADPSFGIAPFTQAESANVDDDEGSECGNPFVDDIAEEKSSGSPSSESEDEAGDDVADPSESGPVDIESRLPVPGTWESDHHADGVRMSARVRTKTTKGEYVKTLLASGLTEELAFDDDVHNDPSVAITSKKLKRPHAVIPSASVDVPDTCAPASASCLSGSPRSSAPSTEVYLEDLGYPPVPVSRPSKKGHTRVSKVKKTSVPPDQATLHVVANVAASLHADATPYTLEKTLVSGCEGEAYLRANYSACC